MWWDLFAKCRIQKTGKENCVVRSETQILNLKSLRRRRWSIYDSYHITYNLKVSLRWGYVLWGFRRWRNYFQVEDWRLVECELKDMRIGKGAPGRGKSMEQIPGDWMCEEKRSSLVWREGKRNGTKWTLEP